MRLFHIGKHFTNTRMWFIVRGYILNSKSTKRRYVITKEKLDKSVIDWRQPRKSLAGLKQQMGLSESSARNSTKLLHLYANTTTIFHTQYGIHRLRRLNFTNLYLYGGHAGKEKIQIRSS